MKRFCLSACCALAALLIAAPAARAGRPIVDPHALDAYFSLFAPDSNIPWRTTTIRLETSTATPVNFSAYAVDVADVVTAGSSARVVDTRHLHAVATWQFTPPGGYQFEASDVDVPLGNREGFFVVEARRGGVAEQVWIDRTRIGLISKSAPDALLVYVTDLGTGRALAHARVRFVVGTSFVTRYTDAHGIVRWDGGRRPIFALAQWGASVAFLAFLPQAPAPSHVVGVRADTAVAHAGDVLHLIGFARTRADDAMRPSTGDAVVSIRSGASPIVEKTVKLDAAGAFSTGIEIPANTKSGDYAVLAQVDGATGGATVRIDGDAGGLSLSATTPCGVCNPDADVPLIVHAVRAGRGVAGVAVHVDVVRSPHALEEDGSSGDDPAWGTAPWLDADATTGSGGEVTIDIPHPTDGLASTYGIRLDGADATAQTRVVVPTSRLVLNLQLDTDAASPGTPVGFTVRAREFGSGKPVTDLPATLTVSRGDDRTTYAVVTDAAGLARGSFPAPSFGTSLVVASATLDGAAAADAAQVQSLPQSETTVTTDASALVHVTADRSAYRNGESARIDAGDVGAVGNALMTLESAGGIAASVVNVGNGTAGATFGVAPVPGDLSAGAAFVRDGTLEWNAAALEVDGPGRPAALGFQLDRSSYAPGATATLTLDATAESTVAVRLSRGTPSGSGRFATLPDLLAFGVTVTQNSAPAVPNWHQSVDSAGRSQSVGFAIRNGGPPQAALAQSDTHAVWWQVLRRGREPIAVPMPQTRGEYTLSILQIGDDGRIAAASSNVTVR